MTAASETSPGRGLALAVSPCVIESGRSALGLAGEDLACAVLEGRGYSIVERRFRTRRGEIDIVARDGGTLVFVEVKGRASVADGSAGEAVTLAKRRRLIQLAVEYLARRHLTDVPCRFDVVTIAWLRGRQPDVQLIADAFTLDDR